MFNLNIMENLMFTFEKLRLNGQKLMDSSTRHDQEAILFNLINIEGMLQIGQIMVTITTHNSHFNHTVYQVILVATVVF